MRHSFKNPILRPCVHSLNKPVIRPSDAPPSSLLHGASVVAVLTHPLTFGPVIALLRTCPLGCTLVLSNAHLPLKQCFRGPENQLCIGNKHRTRSHYSSLANQSPTSVYAPCRHQLSFDRLQVDQDQLYITSYTTVTGAEASLTLQIQPQILASNILSAGIQRKERVYSE